MTKKAKVTIMREIAPDRTKSEGFVGVRAVAKIEIPDGQGRIRTSIKSPGLWGVDPNESEDYLAEVFEEERETLVHMLELLRETV
jgi:hypothetical protein